MDYAKDTIYNGVLDYAYYDLFATIKLSFVGCRTLIVKHGLLAYLFLDFYVFLILGRLLVSFPTKRSVKILYTEYSIH